MAEVEHKHGSLMHAHEGGAGLHWHEAGDPMLSPGDFQRAAGDPQQSQLDRIEASLSRLHERLDAAEGLLADKAGQFGPMVRMFAKALGNGGG